MPRRDTLELDDDAYGARPSLRRDLRCDAPLPVRALALAVAPPAGRAIACTPTPSAAEVRERLCNFLILLFGQISHRMRLGIDRELVEVEGVVVREEK